MKFYYYVYTTFRPTVHGFVTYSVGRVREAVGEFPLSETQKDVIAGVRSIAGGDRIPADVITITFFTEISQSEYEKYIQFISVAHRL